MRQILGILMIAVVIYGVKMIFDRFDEIDRRQRSRSGRSIPQETAPAPAAAPVAPEQLPGFRAGYEAALETSLAEARKQGAPGLKSWLRQNRPYVADPRLAAIELDYIVLLGPAGRLEARKLLDSLNPRIPPDSPLRARFEKLQQLYP